MWIDATAHSDGLRADAYLTAGFKHMSNQPADSGRHTSLPHEHQMYNPLAEETHLAQSVATGQL